MRNKFFSLLKVQLKSGLGGGGTWQKDKKDKKRLGKIALFVFLAVSLIPVYFLYNSLISALFDSLSQVNQAGAVFAIVYVGVSLITFIFGISYVLSSFFGAKDLDMLLSMPIKPQSIVASKLITVIIGEYLLAVPLIAPVFINYALKTNAGFLFWIYSVLMTLISPVIPLAAAAVLSILVVRMFGMRVNIEKLQGFFMIVILIISFGFSFISQKFSQSMLMGSEAEIIGAFIADNTLLIQSITKIYYPARLFAESLINYHSLAGLLHFAMLALIAAIIFYCAVYLGEKIYLRAVMAGIGSSSASKKKKLTQTQFDKSLSYSSKRRSLALTDFKIILRTPVFSYNTLIMIPLLPGLMVLYYFTLDEAQLNGIAMLYENYGKAAAVWASVALTFMVSLSSVTASSFSREGKSHWISQVIPVAPAEQLIGRIGVPVIINTAAITIMGIMLSLFMKMDAVTGTLMVLVGLVGSIPLMLIGLLIDLKRPLLNWDDPAKAVKQNFNVLWGTLFTLLYTILIGGIALLLTGLSIMPEVILGVMLIVGAGTSALLMKYFIKVFPVWIMDK